MFWHVFVCPQGGSAISPGTRTPPPHFLEGAWNQTEVTSYPQNHKSGRYASYWNAFLLKIDENADVTCEQGFTTKSIIWRWAVPLFLLEKMRIHWVCHKSTPFSPVRCSWPVTWLPAFTTWLGSLPRGGGGGRGCHSNLVHGDASIRCRCCCCCLLGCHDDLSLGDGVHELLVLCWRRWWFGLVESDSLGNVASDIFMFLDNNLQIYVAVVR